MARLARLAVPGMPMHIVQRGTDRMPTFLDGQDFAQYREHLKHTSVRHECAIHAYVLMTNHVHLLVTPLGSRNASAMMQALGRLYVPSFNARHGRSGTLWEGRFRSAIVDSATYFLACSRYIDLNPVRAGLVDRAADYEWSSFACLARGDVDPVITLHGEYLRLGRSAISRRLAYREWCNAGDASQGWTFIRRATHDGAMIGSDGARAALALALGRPVTRRPRKDRALQDAELAIPHVPTPARLQRSAYRNSTVPRGPVMTAISAGAVPG